MKRYKIVNRKFSTVVWPLLAAAAILCAVAPAKAAEEKPNIVFMLMDNLGYGELGVYGGGILRGAPTPRIDNLASEGMRLLNFNVEAQCTPSRSALMTGRFSIRSGTYEVPLGGIPDGLTLWEVTIAELLSARGYATGIWGKWHLGSAEERFPTHQGFDEWYGIPRTYDEAMWPSLNETNSMWPSVGDKQGWNANVVRPEYIYQGACPSSRSKREAREWNSTHTANAAQHELKTRPVAMLVMSGRPYRCVHEKFIPPVDSFFD
jgi:arylsulfatase A-like enzyme